MAENDGVKHGVLIKSELVLLEHGNALLWPLGDLTPVWLKSTCQNFQKGRFPGTICPNEAIAVAGGKFDIDVLENNPLPIR